MTPQETQAKRNEVIKAMNEGSLASKSDSELTCMSAVMNSWIASGGQTALSVPALEAIENILAHRRALKLSEQTAILTRDIGQLTAISDKQKNLVESLNGQTGKLVEETVALKDIAKEQRDLAVKLDTLTRWIVALTVALLLLTVGVFVFTIYLYKDTHTEIKSHSATAPNKTEHP